MPGSAASILRIEQMYDGAIALARSRLYRSYGHLREVRCLTIIARKGDIK